MQKKLSVLILLMLLVMSGCGQEAATKGYQQITAEEAKTIIDERDDEIVLDVRQAEEYAEGHLPDAVLLPVSTIDEKTAAAVIPDKDAMLLVYCRSGNRSKSAAQTLSELGYTQVYEFGGIKQWPYEVVTGE